MSKQAAKHVRKADQYDDPTHNYKQYWVGREYEHAAEELAIMRLLKGRQFNMAVDVGGGYGRLSKFITAFSEKVILAEPSKQQLDIAADYLKDAPRVEARQLQAADLKMKSGSVDLVLMVRVLHHLPDPGQEFSEIARVLKPGGTFLLEFANNAHGLNRIRYGLKGKVVPKTPVDIRSDANKADNEIPFVNHHPKMVLRQIYDAGFELEAVLSGSNLRSTRLKRLLSPTTMLSLEKLFQPLLAPLYFGPSIWLRLKKR